MLKVGRLKSSRSLCFVKARFECLPPDKFLAEVVPCGNLAWATVWVLDFLFDLAHIMGNIKFVETKFKFNSHYFKTIFPDISENMNRPIPPGNKSSGNFQFSAPRVKSYQSKR